MIKLINQRKPAKHVIVVSLWKSGTHIVENLMRGLGYETIGEGIKKPQHWSDQKIKDILENISKLPAQSCLFLHKLHFQTLPHKFVVDWTNSHYPPIIFHYRDPRALLFSIINYVLKKTNSGEFTQSTGSIMLSDILANIEPRNRVRVAIEGLREFMISAYEAHSWLFYHPKVCKTSFERLIGRKGGGSDSIQLQEVRKVIKHINASYNPESIVQKLYDPTQRTFYLGQIDSWRYAFTEDEIKLFNINYSRILRIYNYNK